MSIGMSMSLLPELTQSYRLETRLTLKQKQAISAQQIGLWLELVAGLKEERYTPQAHCPSCYRVLEPREILAGFTHNVKDFTTRCTGCGYRFEPKLVVFGNVTTLEIRFFCDVQAQDRLRLVSNKSPAELARNYPGEYRSAIVHYGTLRAMFVKIGISYGFDENPLWHDKVLPFLGRMPDSEIARACGVKSKTIGRLRRKQGISRFTKQVALEEAENKDE